MTLTHGDVHPTRCVATTHRSSGPRVTPWDVLLDTVTKSKDGATGRVTSSSATMEKAVTTEARTHSLKEQHALIALQATKEDVTTKCVPPNRHRL